MNDAILLLILPLIAAFLAPVGKIVFKKFGRFFNLAVYAAGIALSIIFLMRQGANPLIVLGGWRPPFGINLYAGTFSLGVALIMNALALFITVYDLNRERKPYYYLLFNLFIFSSLGMAFTGDLFNLFVFMEIGAITLIALSASENKKLSSKAAFKYAVISGTVSMIMLAAIGLLYSSVGNMNIASLGIASALQKGLALIVALGILAALFMELELFPFNSWVPDIYHASPASFTAAVAGIGGLGALAAFARFSGQLLGGNGAFAYASDSIQLVIVVVALASALVGELAALSEKNVKRLLGYSSIGQMGLMVVAFTVLGEFGIRAGLFLIISHSIAKSMLLLISGFFIRKSCQSDWTGMKGIARSYPLLGTLFIVAALSLMGVPLFAGFWGKYYLIRELLNGALIWKLSAAVILVVTVIEGAYFMRMAHTFFEKNENKREYTYQGILLLTVPTVILALGLIWVGAFPGTLSKAIDGAQSDIQDKSVYVRNVIGVEWDFDTEVPEEESSVSNDMELMPEETGAETNAAEPAPNLTAVNLEELMSIGGQE